MDVLESRHVGSIGVVCVYAKNVYASFRPGLRRSRVHEGIPRLAAPAVGSEPAVLLRRAQGQVANAVVSTTAGGSVPRGLKVVQVAPESKSVTRTSNSTLVRPAAKTQ